MLSVNQISSQNKVRAEDDHCRPAKTGRDIVETSFDRAVIEMRPEARITEDGIATFVEVMRANVLTGDNPSAATGCAP